MRLTILGSGSRGNATVIQHNNGSILIDAGFSYRQLTQKLRQCHIPLDSFTAVVLTHEHTDHCRGIGPFSRIHNVPVYSNRSTYGKLFDETRKDIGRRITFFSTGETVAIDGIAVRSFPVPHDASEPVGFTLLSGKKKIGYATDLGSITDEVVKSLEGSTLLVLEANHDITMLEKGVYPEFLKKRIRSPEGHLSNDGTLALIRQVMGSELQAVYLAHLSKENNCPDIAYRCVHGPLAEKSGFVPEIRVAAQDNTSEPYDL